MDNEKELTPEEKAAEEAALVLPKEEDVRAKVIEEFGFDETADAEKIDKAVAREMEHSKKLSSAIGAKRKWREEAKKPKDAAKPPVEKKDNEKSDLSGKDIFALTQAGVHSDDVDEVVEYANFKGISIAEALKVPLIQSSLAEKAEQRKVADATNTGASRRGNAKLSDEELITKASQGDEVDPDALAAARMRQKKAARE